MSGISFFNDFATGQNSEFHSKMYLQKCKDTYFILQNKYLCIYEDSFEGKILRDDCTQNLFLRWFWWAISGQREQDIK